MAREHARILTRIWRDDNDWRALSWEGQHMYFLLLSQPALTHAGTLPLTLHRWSRFTDGRTPGDIEKAVRLLEDRRFVVVDWETEELLIRSFIRNDGVHRQPNVLKAAWRVITEELESDRLKVALAEELLRVGLTEYAGRLNPSPNPSGNPSPNPPAGGGGTPADSPADTPKQQGFPEPFPEGIQGGSEGVPRKPRGKGEGGVVISSPVQTSSSSAPPPREDVEGLCKHLRDRIVANGSKPPTAAQADGWRNDARLMLDRDKRDLTEAHSLIDWCQDDEFWRSNVLGMPKFRKQYDTLRLRAQTVRHLTAVPAVDAPQSFEAYRDQAAAGEAARLLGIACILREQPPSDDTPRAEWIRRVRIEWLDAHEQEIRAALTERKTG